MDPKEVAALKEISKELKEVTKNLRNVWKSIDNLRTEFHEYRKEATLEPVVMDFNNSGIEVIPHEEGDVM